MFFATVRPRILVMEDELELAKLYQTFLTLKGFEVDIVTNGLQGVEKVAQDTHAGYQCIITVHNMPYLSGYDASCAIRQLVDVPIIMITSDPDAIKALPFEASIDKGFAKPLPLTELYTAVSDLTLRLTYQRKPL
ncbi:MAG: response regulator [Alteromonadaceae bacterium]|nr:response regulator [Alteromonadaceae bacterium]